MEATLESLTSHPFGRGEFDPLEVQYFDFIDFTEDGGPDRSLHPGIDFGPFLFCFNTSESKTVGDITVDVSQSNSVILCVAHGLAVGNQVRFSSDGLPPNGLVQSLYYYVKSATVDALTVSTSNGGPASIFTDNGVGRTVLVKRGAPLDMTGWNVWAWVKVDPDGDDTNKIDLVPLLLTPASLGTVAIYKAGSLTDALITQPVAFWDMVGQDSAGHRFKLAQGKFQIAKLVTHQPFP